MNNTREFIFFRPDVSKYQDPLFRELEQRALSQVQNLNAIYLTKLSQVESEEHKDKKIIFISTSNTICENYQSILPRIVLWLHPNSGFDNINRDFVDQVNFPVLNGNSIRAQAVFLYIISCFNQYLGALPFVESWDSKRSFERKNFYTEKVLVIGYGLIGKKVASYLSISGINFHIHDPFIEEFEAPIPLLSEFDVIILCCNLNKTSRHILNANNLSKLQKEVCIINAARGELIEQNALINYKTRFPEAFAFLDVFEKEPCDLTPFSKLKNIFLTSHIAGVFEGIDQKIIDFEMEILKDFQALSLSDFEVKYKQANLKNKSRHDFLN